MTRRISQSITPTAEDVAALRGPFIAKGANDPVIAALREYFKHRCLRGCPSSTRSRN